MIIDAKLLFSEDQAETTAAAHDSTNTIDLGAGVDEFGNSLDKGVGVRNMLNVLVTTKFTSGGSATLKAELRHSDDASSWSSAGICSKEIPVATLVAGYPILQVGMPRDLKRYLKMVYTIGTAAMTAGKVSAWVGDAAETLPK